MCELAVKIVQIKIILVEVDNYFIFCLKYLQLCTSIMETQKKETLEKNWLVFCTLLFFRALPRKDFVVTIVSVA